MQLLRLDKSAIYVTIIRHVGAHFSAGPVGTEERIEIHLDTVSLWTFWIPRIVIYV